MANLPDANVDAAAAPRGRGVKRRLGHLVAQVVSASGDEPLPFVALENVGTRTGSLLLDTELPLRAPEPTGVTGFRPGDVLFGKLRPYLAKSWRADRSGLCSTELIVMRPRPAVDDHWLGYLVQTDLLVQWATATSEGVKMPRTSWEKLRLLEIDLPSLDTQRAIAAYLDAETARIDAVVNVRRRTSLLVEEHRKARISYFVSTGRPVRVKHAISLCTSGPRGWGDLAGDSGSPFIRSANLSRSSIEINNGGLMFVEPPLSDEADRSRVACGDVLAGITGANTGWIGLVRPEHAGGFVGQHVAILRPDGVEPEWLAYSLVSDRAQQALLSRQYGGTKTQLGLEDLRELEINVPARGKQLALVAELRNVEETVLATQAKIGRQIDLLLERRQALITAAVTGQLQMPGSPPD